MAFRTTAAMMRKIFKFPTSMVDADFDPFIEAGNSVTNDHCLTSGYDTAKLTLIETYLATHFAVCYKGWKKFRAVSKIQESFESEVDLHLNLTRYGQQAMVLDPAGNLAAFNNALDTVKKPLGTLAQGLTYLGRRQGEF